jgi:hypothetical protein
MLPESPEALVRPPPADTKISSATYYGAELVGRWRRWRGGEIVRFRNTKSEELAASSHWA